MSDRSSPPSIFIACLFLLFLFAFPQVSHSQVTQAWDGGAGSPLRGTSATGHLEQMTGQKIGRPGSLSRTPTGGMGGIGGMIGMMMLQSIISEALDASAATSQQAAQRAELEAWMRAEKQRLTDLVTQQRAEREMEDKVSIEELRAAMSGQSVGDKPASDLASALTDPQAVIHNPGGTDFFGLGGGSVSMGAFDVKPVKPTVDLSQRTTKPAASIEDLRIKISKKTREMMVSKQDNKKLIKELQSLQDELSKELSSLVVADLKERTELMRKIARRLNKSKVPPIIVPEYDSLLFLGTTNGQITADGYKRCKLMDWEKMRPYQEIIAPGKEGGLDWLRSIMEHKYALESILSAETMSRLDSLANAHIKHLVAHSNGATVAEVLIRTNYIRVDEFTILGGDRSLFNLEQLKQLAYEKNIKIHIYVHEGDPIAHLPINIQQGAYSPSYYASEITKRIMGINKSPVNDKLVDVTILPAPKALTKFHKFVTYQQDLQTRFQGTTGNPSASLESRM